MPHFVGIRTNFTIKNITYQFSPKPEHEITFILPNVKLDIVFDTLRMTKIYIDSFYEFHNNT